MSTSIPVLKKIRADGAGRRDTDSQRLTDLKLKARQQ